MHTQSLDEWEHEHTFGQDEVRPGEKRTQIVLAITAAMMVVEVVAGILYGSMALLADGMHMGSHAVALAISAVAYLYARKYAGDRRFSFGTGKVNGLAGYTSAVILAVFAISMGWESISRFFNPVEIAFNQAILVAAVGLGVNVASAWILKERHEHEHEGEDEDGHHHQHTDHNLRSAYLHVLADALTSVLAIVALLGGKSLGLVWMDPVMGVVGAVLVGRWSISLIRDTSRVLLDQEGPEGIRKAVVAAIESQADNRVSDLHLWSIGPGIYAAAISVVTSSPMPPEAYKQLIPEGIGLRHTTIEVYPCV